MQQKWLILSSVACGTFMSTLDSSIVNVALPSITVALNTSLSTSRWVVISYLFSITGLLLFFGKLADVIGRKFIFNVGFLIFTLGSLCCGLSSHISQLILSRGLQGLGAAMLMSNGPAIITSAFPANERGKALGTLAMVVSAGLAIGPTVGGLLVRFFSWPSIFFVNIPFGILGGYLVYRNVPKSLGVNILDSEIHTREQGLPWSVKTQLIFEKLRYFDWLGAILWMFIQFGYSLAIDQENALGLAGPLQKILSFGSAGLFILFLIWEWSIKDAVLDLSLFRSRVFLSSNISGLFSFIAISSVTLLMPFYLQNTRGLPPHKVGLIMTAVPMTIFFIAPISGRLSDAYGSRFLSTLGMSLLCLSMTLLATPNYGLSGGTTTTLILFLVLFGSGIGFFQSPNNNAIMGAVSQANLGVASALIATVRNFGLVTGAALSTGLLVFFNRQGLLFVQSRLDPTLHFVTGMRYTLLVLAGICSLGIFTSLIRGPILNASKN